MGSCGVVWYKKNKKDLRMFSEEWFGWVCGVMGVMVGILGRGSPWKCFVRGSYVVESL